VLKCVGTLALCLALAATIVLPVRSAPALAQDYTVDRAASDELTDYLRNNRLPLVGAQVLKTADGQKRLMLYGFVASNHGKHDAETKALAHLGGSGITVDNRIAVRPEIGRLKSHTQPAASSTAAPEAGTVSFDQVIDDIQRYGVKSPPGDEDLNGP
jgi:hypothetical protein